MVHATLNAALNMENLPLSRENRLVYIRVDVVPLANVIGGQASLNISLVIDKSGSMYQEGRLRYVQEAVKYVIDNLRPQDIISLAAFAGSAQVILPAQTISDKASAKGLIDGIDDIDVGSTTKMLEGIQKGCIEVKKNFSPDRINRVIILTDGLTKDPVGCEIEVQKQHRQQLTFSTIGVGNEFNESLLLSIATKNGGKSYYIDKPDTIGKIFAEELRGMQSVVLRNIRIFLKMLNGVRLKRCFKAHPQIIPIDLPAPIEQIIISDLGDISLGEQLSLLWELELPPRIEVGPLNVLLVEASYDTPEGTETLQSSVSVNYTSDTNISNEVNADVTRLVDIVSIFDRQAKAQAIANTGERNRATRLLRAAATTALNLGDAGLAQTLDIEANNVQQTGRASPKGTKMLEYSTRRLTQILDTPKFKQK